MTFEELVDIEKKQSAAVEQLKEDIVKKVSETNLPGVKPISTNPTIFTVPFSVFSASSWNMTAEYYSAQAQSGLVQQNLAPAKTATDIAKKVNTMLDTKTITNRNTKQALNPAVLGALESSIPKSLRSET